MAKTSISGDEQSIASTVPAMSARSRALRRLLPARPMAQTLASAEAVIGQMFVAIFIGGLVAQHIGAVQERRRNAA